MTVLKSSSSTSRTAAGALGALPWRTCIPNSGTCTPDLDEPNLLVAAFDAVQALDQVESDCLDTT